MPAPCVCTVYGLLWAVSYNLASSVVTDVSECCAVLHPDKTVRCGQFAAALLAGAVCPAFTALVTSYNCKPSMAGTPEGRALQRISDLVLTLVQRSVDSKATLRAAWTLDGAFLRYADFLRCLWCVHWLDFIECI